jgi:adenosine deaminase
LPKAELHAHLHGSIRKATALRYLTEDNALTEEKRVLLMDTVPDINTAFLIFGIFHSVVTSAERVYELTKEVLDDYAGDNVTHLELRTTPRATDGMTKEEYLAAVCRAIDEDTSGMVTKLVLSVNRGLPIEQAQENLSLACRTPHVVGLDFSGNPKAAQFATFRDVFT